MLASPRILRASERCRADHNFKFARPNHKIRVKNGFSGLKRGFRGLKSGLSGLKWRFIVSERICVWESHTLTHNIETLLVDDVVLVAM